MANETEESGATQIYSPAELAAIMQGATEAPADEQPDYRHLLPVIALGSLAGLRLGETVRVTWEDVWRVADHIEITTSKSKTRQRRLVDMVPALAQWLAPYRKSTGKVWKHSLDRFHNDFGALRTSIKVAPRRNGFRHSFASFHFALNQNENETAAQCGNSPTMVHKHYKGLATKKEAEAWCSTCGPCTL